MPDSLIYALQTILCLGAFLLLYKAVVAGRTSFSFSRAYLLAASALAFIIPVLSIPVYPSTGVVVQEFIIPFTDASPVAAGPLTDGGTAAPVETVVGTTVIWKYIYTGLYLAVTVFMLSFMIVELLKIRRIRRAATRIGGYKYTVYESATVKAPFSSSRSIFIGDGLDASETEQIVSHESSHIRHGHFYEKAFISVLRAVAWFNPFLWVAKRYLAEVHEYEADRDVLSAGHDLTEYRKLILKQILGYNPDITCGLNNSLTKRRFIMMTRKNIRKGLLLRTAAAVCLTGCLVMLFSFTTKPAENTETLLIFETAASFEESNDPVTWIVTGIPFTRDNNGNRSTPESYVLPSYMIKSIRYTPPREPRNGMPAGPAVLNIQGELNMGTASGTTGLFFMDSNNSQIPDIDLSALTVDDIEKVSYRKADGSSPDRLIVHLKQTPSKASDPVWRVNGRATELTKINPGTIKAMKVTKDDSRGGRGVIDVTTYSPEEITSMPDVQIKIKDHDDPPFITAETMPKFQDGSLQDFRQWIQQNLRYPEFAQTNNIQGTVIVQFVIEKDGSLTSVNQMRSPDESLFKEAKRVLESSPKWTPGEQKGQKVRIRYTMPIEFKISGSETKPDSDPEVQPEIVMTVFKTPSGTESPQNEEPLVTAETMPMFQDGDLMDFRTWVHSELRYPDEAKANKIEGKVFVHFVIEKDGSLTSVSHLRSPHPSMYKEVERVLNSSPKWTPGEQKGQKVRVRFTMPIDFSLAA